jgi:hypothetical protein
MKRPSEAKAKYKPTPSRYQLYLRGVTIKLIVAFGLVAVAIGAAIYYYQRRSMFP